MTLINCEALRQALFLYVSTLGFITYHLTHGIWESGNYNATWIADSLKTRTGRPIVIDSRNENDKIRNDIVLRPSTTLATDTVRIESTTHPHWAAAVRCQTLYDDQATQSGVEGQQKSLNIFDTSNSSSIPLNACSTVHIQVPLTSVVWCGPTDLERLGPELRTLMDFLSSTQMDVVVIEGGTHYTGLLGLLALGSGSSVYVISPYSDYLNAVHKSVVLTKLPPRIFLYHNIISEIRGKVKLSYSPALKRYLPNCEYISSSPRQDESSDPSSTKRKCMTEIVTTATMEHALKSLLTISTQQSGEVNKPILIRASFANIHQVNGFLDSPEFFQRVCVQVIMVDISLLGSMDREWLNKGLSRMEYQAYTLNGNPWDASLSDSIVVWTTAFFY